MHIRSKSFIKYGAHIAHWHLISKQMSKMSKTWIVVRAINAVTVAMRQMNWCLSKQKQKKNPNWTKEWIGSVVLMYSARTHTQTQTVAKVTGFRINNIKCPKRIKRELRYYVVRYKVVQFNRRFRRFDRRIIKSTINSVQSFLLFSSSFFCLTDYLILIKCEVFTVCVCVSFCAYLRNASKSRTISTAIFEN